MRILQISNKAPYPANDGSSIAIYNMAKGLIENGAQLHLLCINTKKHFKADEKMPPEFRQDAHYTSVYKNTNTSFFGALFNLFGKQSYFVSRFHFSSFRKILLKKLKETDFDLIQIEGLFMASYLPIIRQYSTAKIVLRAHNIEHRIWERHIFNTSQPLKKFYLNLQNRRLKRFEIKVLQQVDAIVPISIADEVWFRATAPEKAIFTCITGVDIAEYQKQKMGPQKKATVFSFGSMDWLPNQEAVKWFLQNCWLAILKEVPDAKLIIAGRGMPLDFFHITIPNVSIIENVENAANFYAQHQIMIVPLHSGSGLRIKIIEGMAYGKAIVSTSIGAEGIHVKSGKELILADTAQNFTSMVVSLLQDQNLRISLEDQASAFAKTHFNNKQVVAGLFSFYQNTMHA